MECRISGLLLYGQKSDLVVCVHLIPRIFGNGRFFSGVLQTLLCGYRSRDCPELATSKTTMITRGKRTLSLIDHICGSIVLSFTRFLFRHNVKI